MVFVVTRTMGVPPVCITGASARVSRAKMALRLMGKMPMLLCSYPAIRPPPSNRSTLSSACLATNKVVLMLS